MSRSTLIAAIAGGSLTLAAVVGGCSTSSSPVASGAATSVGTTPSGCATPGGPAGGSAASAGDGAASAGDAATSTDITVQWHGAWDTAAAPALFERWDEAAGGVRVGVAPVAPAGATPALVDQPDGPTLTRVPADAVAPLAAAGRIRPIDPCVPVPGGDTLGEAAASLGLVDGVRYGVTSNVGGWFVVYDRAAFERAGLDPDRPPSTPQELVAAATALHDVAGIATPVAGYTAWHGASGTALDGTTAPAGVDAWAQLDDAGLLAPSSADDAVPPLGDGRAAIEVVHQGGLWGYASALAQGQAPDADLAVAPLPTADGPAVPVHGDVWVISAEADDAQAAVATSLLAWLAEPAQQAALHSLTDLFPTAAVAADEAVEQAYVEELPLVGQARALLGAHATAPAPWELVPGAALTLHTLDDLAGADRAAGVPWAAVSALIAAGETTLESSPLPLLGCAYPAAAPPAPLVACEAVLTGG